MHKPRILLLLSFLISSCCSISRAQELKVIPYPRELRFDGEPFRVTPNTRIVVPAKHRSDDATAAEMLAEEIRSAIGQRARVVFANVSFSRSSSGKNSDGPFSHAIYLTRMSDAGVSSQLKAANFNLANSDDKFKEEGYLLHVSRSRVMVAAQSGAGIFYGVQTLRQMLLPEGGHALLPGVAIRDWPQVRWRGVHDDVSRGPIPTLDYMKEQVRTLAAYKINLLSIYMESVFAFANNPLIAPKEAAIAPNQIRDLVAYARKYYVTILPEQQAFGHLHHVLKYEIYNDLAETPHGHVLAPANPKSYDFIKSMYSELVPLFPSPLFHIGCDETFELGRGQSKELADKLGLGRVYLEHLQKVSEIMQPYGKRLMFWADVAQRYPDLLSILPKSMIPVAWSYGARENFDSMLKPFRDAGFEMFVSPGANNWNRIYPNMDVAYVNIQNFVRDGQKFGAIGVLNTTWDDDGESLFGMTWPALVYGAAASWEMCGTAGCSLERFKRNFDWAFYRNLDNTLIAASDNLSSIHKQLADVNLGGAFDELFWDDPFTEAGAMRVKQALPAAHGLRLAAERAVEAIYNAQNKNRVRYSADSLEELALAGWRLDALGMKIQFVGEINSFYWDAFLHLNDRARVGRDLNEITSINARLQDLRDSITRLRSLYQQAWLSESRPYWLGNVLVRYDNLASLYQHKIQQMNAALQQYREKMSLPTPESLGLYLKPESEAGTP